MKEVIVGIATCGCKHCRWGQTKSDIKERNRKRRLHTPIDPETGERPKKSETNIDLEQETNELDTVNNNLKVPHQNI